MTYRVTMSPYYRGFVIGFVCAELGWVALNVRWSITDSPWHLLSVAVALVCTSIVVWFRIRLQRRLYALEVEHRCDICGEFAAFPVNDSRFCGEHVMVGIERVIGLMAMEKDVDIECREGAVEWAQQMFYEAYRQARGLPEDEDE